MPCADSVNRCCNIGRQTPARPPASHCKLLHEQSLAIYRCDVMTICQHSSSVIFCIFMVEKNLNLDRISAPCRKRYLCLLSRCDLAPLAVVISDVLPAPCAGQACPVGPPAPCRPAVYHNVPCRVSPLQA